MLVRIFNKFVLTLLYPLHIRREKFIYSPIFFILISFSPKRAVKAFWITVLFPFFFLIKKNNNFLLFVSGSIIQGSLEKNNTLKLKNENFPSNLNFTGFKERHRRLVPYMTYYLVGNNVENQSPRSTKYEKNRERNIPRKSQIRQNLNSRERNFFARQKFSPSVQYDPKELGPNNAYFTPIRYGMKLNQKDYSSFTYQNARPVYSRPTVENIVPENKILLTTETPKKLQNPPERNYLPLNVIKTIPSTVDDYYLDYETHGKQYDYEQPFESFRYTDKIQIFKPPISRPNDFKVPVSELDHIVKTLQLSNQLPEMLNKDNIDSSIRTLVEILNILHNARRSQQSQIPNPVKLKSKPPDYGFNEDLTRPQVLETNYYVTPNVIDRPQEIFPDKITEPLHPLMNFKSKPKNQKIIQYYVPKDLEINNQYKEIYSQSNENDTENQSFNLHSVNTLENDRFKYPISTEKPTNNYPVPNVPKDTQNIPPSLKYGATRGKPHVDYPAYSTIPPTNFNCKQQRYKGFFGDPATRCQVTFYSK